MVILEERKISDEQRQNFICGTGSSTGRSSMEFKEREEIVSGADAGFGDSVESRALGDHLGFDKTEEKIASRVWWPSIRKDVRNYIKACDRCQRRAPRFQKGSEKLHRVEIPPHPWSQIGVDICSMPTSKEGYTCMVVDVDYFSKWTEAEALHRKTTEGVANFLYNCICRHGCYDIRINDTGREFVNSISTELYRLTGVKQRITSPYHPQANGLVERSNRTIQDMMMELFSDASLVDNTRRQLAKSTPGHSFCASNKQTCFHKVHSVFLTIWERAQTASRVDRTAVANKQSTG
ncbi:Pol polyprotein [Plakobranchus ocellatus]|uniref:Pol polyprotein n=1 Tax=Plakobranchus ocellatus TaxID=259542 RepID=A0AAV4A2Z4_9GAST|nr:Pol polyprotein [Plakobranchus ocellatus]